jgi:hypothetical protein
MAVKGSRHVVIVVGATLLTKIFTTKVCPYSLVSLKKRISKKGLHFCFEGGNNF